MWTQARAIAALTAAAFAMGVCLGWVLASA
jgi:hypothetical protein